MPEIKAGAINLYYEEAGAGEPLLLINGFGGSSAGWRPEFVSQLAESFRVIAFDNRGTGRSDKPESPTSIAEMADDAAALLAALGIERAHIVGISMGGMIAQEFALRHPQRVVGLVLGCTNMGMASPLAVPAAPEIVGLLSFPEGMDPREAARRAWPTSYTDEFIAGNRDFLEAALDRTLRYPTPPATRARQMEAIRSWSSLDRLGEITMPALIITGDKDALVPAANSRLLHERIPGSTLHVIPGAGHVFFNSHPDESATTITNFLTSVSAVAAR